MFGLFFLRRSNRPGSTAKKPWQSLLFFALRKARARCERRRSLRSENLPRLHSRSTYKPGSTSETRPPTLAMVRPIPRSDSRWSSCPPLHDFAGRNSFAKLKGSGQEAPVVWPRPLGLVGRGLGVGRSQGRKCCRLLHIFTIRTVASNF